MNEFLTDDYICQACPSDKIAHYGRCFKVPGQAHRVYSPQLTQSPIKTLFRIISCLSESLNPYAGIDTNWYPHPIVVSKTIDLGGFTTSFENKT